MKVTATVVYSIQISVDVIDDSDAEETHWKILDEAKKVIKEDVYHGWWKPLTIQECSEPDVLTLRNC
jgi:hypothetical protein